VDVLVVDDDPDIRHMLAFSLEGHGLTVRTAADGDAALRQLAADPPACMVLDLMMPDVDGFTVLERLRDDPDAPAVRVLVLSCRSDEAAQARAAELGAAGYLVKPTDPDLLAARIVALAPVATAP
jgi:DNA-binding response OmpR family regulator